MAARPQNRLSDGRAHAFARASADGRRLLRRHQLFNEAPGPLMLLVACRHVGLLVAGHEKERSSKREPAGVQFRASALIVLAKTQNRPRGCIGRQTTADDVRGGSAGPHRPR